MVGFLEGDHFEAQGLSRVCLGPPSLATAALAKTRLVVDKDAEFTDDGAV